MYTRHFRWNYIQHRDVFLVLLNCEGSSTNQSGWFFCSLAFIMIQTAFLHHLSQTILHISTEITKKTKYIRWAAWLMHTGAQQYLVPDGWNGHLHIWCRIYLQVLQNNSSFVKKKSSSFCSFYTLQVVLLSELLFILILFFSETSNIE